jgi:hypothetical protein
MGRKNIFSKSAVKEEITDQIKQSSNHQVCQSSTLDNLPHLDFNLELPITNFELIINGSANTQTKVIVDLAQKIDFSRLSNKEKKGKIFLPWLHSLYKSNPTDAIFLLRIYIKFLKEEKINTHKGIAYNWISDYILEKSMFISELKLIDFSNIVEDHQQKVERGTLVYIINIAKTIISAHPHVTQEIKERLKDYKLPNALSSKKGQVLTAEERIKKYRITNDYSDYVMFQIYAYTNACLMDIKETNERLAELLKENLYLDLFSSQGRIVYRTHIESNTSESFEKALDMELIAFSRISDAYTKLIQFNESGYNLNLISVEVKQLKYENAFNMLPEKLQADKSIHYLFYNVFPLAIGQNKSNSKYLNNFGLLHEPRLHAFLNKVTQNWRDRKNFTSSYEAYKRYLVDSYFVYSLFYGDRKDKDTPLSASGEGFHNILLGKTNHFDYLTMILLLCESGRNREVALSASAYVKIGMNKISVLEIKAEFSTEPSCWIHGYKTRGHLSGKGVQEEDFVIPFDTPLFKYLELLNKIRSITEPQREYFFRQGESKQVGNYTKSLGRQFAKFCGIKEKDGAQLSNLNTPKFRKVWSGEVLLEYLKDIHTKDDLIKAVAEDLRNTVPLTYLLQSSRTEGMLASAIVGLQLKFIDHHQNLAAQLKIDGEKPPKKGRITRYLCDCTDPSQPDYADNLNVKYCKQFDMCLGCSKAVVYEEHLPNLIYRCFQYEQMLEASSELYSAYYETKHNRAIQALDRFKAKTDNGKIIHANAFKFANKAWNDPDIYLLPPLIHPNINNLGDAS